MFSMEFNTSQKTSALTGQKFCSLWKPVPHKPLENGTTEIIVSCTNTHWNTHIFTIPLLLWRTRFLCTETSITALFFGCILTLLTTNSTLQPFGSLKSRRGCFPLCAVTGTERLKDEGTKSCFAFPLSLGIVKCETGWKPAPVPSVNRALQGWLAVV